MWNRKETTAFGLVEQHVLCFAITIALCILLAIVFKVKMKKLTTALTVTGSKKGDAYEIFRFSRKMWSLLDGVIAWSIFIHLFIIDELFLNTIPLFGWIIAFCPWVILADSTDNLSIGKVMIASILFTPIVVFILLKYNNKQSKEDAAKYIDLAQKAIADGAYEEAVKEADKAIEVCPKTEDDKYLLAKGYFLRGTAYSRKGERELAMLGLGLAFSAGVGDTFLASVQEEIRKINGNGAGSTQAPFAPSPNNTVYQQHEVETKVDNNSVQTESSAPTISIAPTQTAKNSWNTRNWK